MGKLSQQPRRGEMRYRQWGKTGDFLSVFTLGTMRGLGDKGQFQATVQRAIAGGINHVETAQGYGQSERYLGDVLQSYSRNPIYVTSKLCPEPDRETFKTKLYRSLERLQRDYLDNFAFHGINTPEHWQWVQDLWPLIDQAQTEGLIRHIGFSTHGTWPLVETLLRSQRFAFVNLHYYWFNRHLAPAIALAQDLGMGILIISPVDKGGQLHTPPPRLQALCDPFTPLEINYRFLLSDPRITTLTLGAANPEELTPALTFGDCLDPLTDAEKAVLHRLETTLTDTLGSTACHQCYACLPCPEGINIPEILRLRNLSLAYDMKSFGQYRYGMLENAGHWFPGRRGDRCTDCGDCLPRCPHQLPIPTLLRQTHEQLKGPGRRRLWQD